MTCSKISVLALIFVTHYVKAQEYIDNVIPSKYGPHFKDLPKRFEVRGEDANMQFQKYFEQVQEIARLDNLTVVYKIILETIKPNKYKKPFLKKGKTKKYKIPLKKNSMKLSNFEVWLRKMAEQTGHGNNVKKYELYVPVTTESDINKITPMKQIKLKYKPVISKVKNYTKFIRPVKNRIITLTK